MTGLVKYNKWFEWERLALSGSTCLTLIVTDPACIAVERSQVFLTKGTQLDPDAGKHVTQTNNTHPTANMYIEDLYSKATFQKVVFRGL